jgi:hypothetical protein
MYDIKQLFAKCEKVYKNGDIFIAYINNFELFPVSITLATIKQTTIQKEYDKVTLGIQKLKSSGLPLVYKEFSFKALGKQTLPQKIVFDTLDKYLKIIKKENEYNSFIKSYNQIICKYPELKELFLQKPFLVLEYNEFWEKLLDIVDFFILNEKPNIYIRELPLKNIDTKFIEKYKKIIDILISTIKQQDSLNSMVNFSFEKKYHLKYPQALIRFRILDERYFINNLSDLTLPLDDFRSLDIQCQNIFIVENKITTLSFPNIKNSIVIFGQGYGVTALKNITWLKEKNIFYWGDIDFDGFAILSQLRGYFPQTVSLMMDEYTINTHKDLKVEATSQIKEKLLLHLTQEENELYQKLLNEFYGKNFRLEQERLPFEYIYQKLDKIHNII